MHTPSIGSIVADRILATDVDLLNDHNVSDKFMATLAAEHAARVETLSKAICPTLGRPLLTMIAGALLETIKQIDASCIVHPETVSHA